MVILANDRCGLMVLVIGACKKALYPSSVLVAHWPRRAYGLAMKHLIVSALVLLPLSAASESLHVRDADTIVVDGTPVRLNGVDAPELASRAGRDAKRWVVNFLRNRSVKCKLNGDRTYDRWVGTCYADGQDIGAAVIAAGHALDCRRFSGGRYRHLETPAAKSRLRRATYCR